MYRFKNKEDFKVYNQTNAAKVIGITRQYLNNVVNGRVYCSKSIAYCITKFIDYNKEIENFFERV